MKVLYVKNGDSSFIRLDEEILKNNFNTFIINLNNTGRYTYFLQLLKLIFILAVILPFRSIAYTRFADWHTAIISFFCKLYNKKLVVVVGGYDASWLPEYGHGVYDRNTRGNWAKYALRNASVILPNNPSLINNTNDYIPGVSRKGGIDFFVPRRKGKLRVLYNAYHTNFWIPVPGSKQDNLVITVAFINSKRTYDIKGVKDFIEAAGNMPDLRFRLIGAGEEQLKQWIDSIPENLAIIGSMNRNELLLEYQKAKVFCLLSLTEGMPNVLCEAMLCECIPVVSAVNFNAELVGESGFVVEKQDPSLIKNAIRRAVDSDENQGKKARARIAENYPFERREKELIRILRDLKPGG